MAVCARSVNQVGASDKRERERKWLSQIWSAERAATAPKS